MLSLGDDHEDSLVLAGHVSLEEISKRSELLFTYGASSYIFESLDRVTRSRYSHGLSKTSIGNPKYVSIFLIVSSFTE
jgi:hypothetical protein